MLSFHSSEINVWYSGLRLTKLYYRSYLYQHDFSLKIGSDQQKQQGFNIGESQP
jgi:hypothetical protein